MSTSAKQAISREARGDGAVEAALLEIGDDGMVTARLAGPGPASVVRARVLATAGFRPQVGNRVVLAGAFVIGAIEAADVGPILALADGAEARLEDGALALRDAKGRLLLRYDNGALEVSAPAADLKLTAPRGRVVIEAATDVSISAARDLAHSAGRRVELRAGDPASAPRLRVEPTTTQITAENLKIDARKGTVVVGEGSIVARALTTTAESLATNVARYELTAQQLVERAGEAFRDVKGLLQQRLGRARTIVDEGYELQSNRTTLNSQKETSIDGEKILIG